MKDTEKLFDEAMLNIYLRAKSEIGYTASKFLQMLHERRGRETARYLINCEQPSEGYTRLFEHGRLDLAVEAVVVENKQWHTLFTPEELAKATKRLKDYHYKIKAA